MIETFYLSLEAKVNLSGRSRKLSSEAPLQSRENLTATLRQSTRGTTWRIKPMIGQPNGPLPAGHTSGLRTTKSADMSGAGSNTAGLRSSLPGALKNCIQNYRSAMKRFTNGSTLMPEILFRPWSGRIATASDEAIHGATRKLTFRREYRSKNAPNKSCCAKSQGIGKQTPQSRAKVWRRYRSALSARPDLPSSPNCSGKGLAR